MCAQVKPYAPYCHITFINGTVYIAEHHDLFPIILDTYYDANTRKEYPKVVIPVCPA